MNDIEIINGETFEQMNAIKEFVKEAGLKLFDEICVFNYEYRLFLDVSGKNAEEEYYEIWRKFDSAHFTVLAMSYYKKGTNAHSKPYMILSIDKESEFFKTRVFELSKSGKCELKDGNITLCNEMKQHLDNTILYPTVCTTFKTTFVGPKLKKIKSEGIKLQFCPFCGEKLSDTNSDNWVETI